MNCDVCGYYMLHCRCPEDAPPEAQAEIARLQAEVERLTEELTASCARAEMQQREAERLRRNSSALHDTIEKIFAAGAKQMARADTAWNEAIEAAAEEAANWWAYLHDEQDRDGPIAESIRALKRTRGL